ncbi:unnamed protein product [Cuscuta epithymum]|uniref:Endonuclease/exonuclease/phosphatase domain-containing protein n=1 Tax=Cuscuta epithymum TaxID=186058 RepID=A0AAV0DTU4_9ASTE|nr:unnamed protein product [Cuscuta epithymum]
MESSKVELTVIEKTSQALHCNVISNDFHIICSLLYIRPNQAAKERCWTELREFKRRHSGLWLAMGDFNSTLWASEQCGGNILWNAMDWFRDQLSSCDLYDVGTEGAPFTWIKREGSRVTLRKRLDRVVWNEEAHMIFPEGKVMCVFSHLKRL